MMNIMKKTLLVAILMMQLGTVYAASGTSDSPDWADLAMKTINFVILFAILYRFGKKPFLSFISSSMESRSQKYLQAKNQEKEAQKKMSDYEARIESLTNELERFKMASAKEMQAEKDKILSETRELVENIKNQTSIIEKGRIQQIREELMSYIAQKTVDEIAKDIEANPKLIDSQNLTDQFIENFKTAK